MAQSSPASRRMKLAPGVTLSPITVMLGMVLLIATLAVVAFGVLAA